MLGQRPEEGTEMNWALSCPLYFASQYDIPCRFLGQLWITPIWTVCVLLRSQHRAAVAFAHTEVSGKRQEPMPLVLGHEGGISVDRGLMSMYGQLTMGTR